MFANHRRDLKEAHAETIKQMERMIVALSDEIDYLRHLLDDRAYVRPSTPAANPSALLPATPGEKLYLSEEEEEALALKMNGYIDEADWGEIESQLGVEITTD